MFKAFSTKPAYNSANKDQMMNLMAQLSRVEAPAEVCLMEAGAYFDLVYYIEIGHAEVTPLGKVLSTVAGPESVLDDAALNSETSLHTIKSTEPLVVWALDKWTVRHILRNTPQARLDKILKIISKLPWLKGMPDDVLWRLSTSAHEMRVKQGENIINAGERHDHLYIIMKGEVEELGLVAGKLKLWGTLHANDFFGERGLLHKESQTSTFRAGAGTEVLRWDPDAFFTLLQPCFPFFESHVRASDAVIDRRISMATTSSPQSKPPGEYVKAPHEMNRREDMARQDSSKGLPRQESGRKLGRGDSFRRSK